MRRLMSMAGIVLAIVVALGVSACGGSGSTSGGGTSTGSGPARSGGSSAKGSIPIGILIPQSGNAAATGQFMTQGAIAAVNQINASGGVDGHKMSYKVFDTVGDPQDGINAYNQFRSDGLQFGITGFSDVVTAIAPLAAKQNVFLLNSGAPPVNTKSMGAHIMATLNGETHEVVCAAKYAYDDLHARSVASIYAQAAGDAGGINAFNHEFESLGGKVTSTESETLGTTSFQSLLTQIKSQNPNLVFLYTYGADPGNIMKQMKELGMSNQAMGTSASAVPQTVQVGGSAANGSVYTSGYFNPNQNTPAMKAYLKYYGQLNKTPKSELGFYNATLYDGVQMLAKAMEYVHAHGGNMLSPSQVQAAFYKIGSFPALTGTAKYTQGNSIPSKPFQILKIENGKFVPTGTVTC
jgi:branched-chain amino acid transport system substrate-binding protein